MRILSLCLIVLLFSACDQSSSSTDTCGDNVADVGEQCDGEDLGGVTCISLGYYTGTLSCSSNCTLNISECVGSGQCGDGVLNLEHGEECDGTNLDNTTCEDLDYYEGTLACNDGCLFDTSGCIGLCGDGEVTHDEECDGDNFNGLTCADIDPDYHSGTLSCDSDRCEIYDDDCNWCGDGILNGPEQCDNTDLGGATCHDLDATYYNGLGTLTCDGTCGFDVSDCRFCGDGRIDGTEICDGDNIGTNPTCGQMGYAGGSPTCTACGAIDYSSCNDWVQISAGFSHTCAIDSLGGVWCWGEGTYGRLGTGSSSHATSPSSVPLPAAAVSVSAGTSHTCAVTTAGEAWCWGRNNYGQLGTNDLVDKNVPTMVYGTSAFFTQIAAGLDHTCAVADDTKVYCWGNQETGKLGNCYDTGTAQIPSVVQTGCGGRITHFFNEAVQVAVGNGHSCARTRVDLETRLYCWGSNSSGQLGINMNAGADQYVAEPARVIDSYGAYLTSSDVSLGAAHSCAISLDGTTQRVYCWGGSAQGQVGHGLTANSLSAVTVLVPPGDPAGTLNNGHTLASGANHVCVSNVGDGFYCWGDADFYQLAGGSNVDSLFAIPATLISGAVAMSAGQSHTCWISQGRIFCVGRNDYGALGDGTTTNATTTATLALIP